MSKNRVIHNYNVPALTMLGVLFIGLKLGGVIAWPWWIVTAPLWGPWAVVLGFIVGGLLVAALCAVLAVFVAAVCAWIDGRRA